MKRFIPIFAALLAVGCTDYSNLIEQNNTMLTDVVVADNGIVEELYSSDENAVLTLDLSGEPIHTISPYLVSMHTVYYNEKDIYYADGLIAQWAKSTNVGSMRFPGGTVLKYWDWENPTGSNDIDTYSSDYDPESPYIKDESEMMSLDEYLTFVDQSGITPLFGVNYHSGYKYGKVSQSIERAARMVKYVKEYRGGIYAGAYWYIGNEDRALVGGESSAASLFARHAYYMKKEDPDIKIFYNHNESTPANVVTYLNYVESTISSNNALDLDAIGVTRLVDGAEFHGKWPLGGTRGSSLVPTLEEWQNEVPLLERNENGVGGENWRDRASEMRAKVQSTAALKNIYGDMLFANNEYGFGQGDLSAFNRYQKGLVLVDFTQEFILGDYDMSAFWSNFQSDDESLFSTTSPYRMNPLGLGHELIGKTLGGGRYEVTTTVKNVFGYASQKDDYLYICILNKNTSDHNLYIKGVDLDDYEFVEKHSMINSEDGFGQIVRSTASWSDEDGDADLVVKAVTMSYNRFTFKRK